MRQKQFEPDNNHGNPPGTLFLAAYVGPSMNPTLREPEIMEIIPYVNTPLRVGDVVFFLSPETDHPIVHRVNRVTPAGITTLGDNNPQEDTLFLQPKCIKGQVVAAWRGQKRRKIAGGTRGWWISRWLHWKRIPDHGLSLLLHPLYQFLSHRGLIAWVLPASFQPRVVVFHAMGRDQYKLLLGSRIIGCYDDQRQLWLIQRPFKLFVDERTLPRQHCKDRMSRQDLAEQQRL